MNSISSIVYNSSHSIPSSLHHHHRHHLLPVFLFTMILYIIVIVLHYTYPLHSTTSLSYIASNIHSLPTNMLYTWWWIKSFRKWNENTLDPFSLFHPHITYTGIYTQMYNTSSVMIFVNAFVHNVYLQFGWCMNVYTTTGMIVYHQAIRYEYV